MNERKTVYRAIIGAAAMLCLSSGVAAQAADTSSADNQASLAVLGKQLKVGDVVFIRIPVALFVKVADTTNSWTNHVGVVIDDSGPEPVIAESRFPLSGRATWSKFGARSEAGRVAVRRLPGVLSLEQRDKITNAATVRFGRLYDTGFDLHSRGEFCSRYVREVLDEALNVKVGQIENFSTLLSRNPKADLSFWRAWYFGYIPWQRETVTPASLLNDPALHNVFDGHIKFKQE